MKERPNLLWIMTDQQRTDSIGAYGNAFIKTPNLDRLAGGGVRFNRCYIATSPCSPSRASLLTGLYAHTHGVVRNGIPLAENLPALGDVLKAEGYRTAWIGKWHLGGPQHGFTDKWVEHGRDYREYLEGAGLLQTFGGVVRGRGKVRTGVRYGRSPIPEEHYLETFLAREAIAFLEESGSEPFCLCVSFRAPHPPVTPPEPWDRMYPRDKLPLPGNFHDDLENKPSSQRWLQRLTAEEEWRDHAAHYYGYVSYVDKWTGKVIETLDRQGLAKDTIVLFTTDHGEMLGSHGFTAKAGKNRRYAYDEAWRVPLIMRYPPLIEANTSIDALVSNVDILPTLLEMTGAPTPPGVQGQSFLSLLRGEPGPRREAVFMDYCDPSAEMKGVRTDRWKYAVNWRPREIDELYDMRDDPLELNNLATDPEHADVCGRLRKRILDWIRETRDPELEQFMEATKHPPRRP